MIRCWRYRRTISNHVDDGTALPGAVRAHVEQCPACRAHYETETSIARKLAAGARAQDRQPSPFLHARIMSSLAEAPPVPHNRPLLARAIPIALGVACVLSATALWLRNPRPPGASNPSVAAGEPVAIEPLLAMAWPKELKLRELTGRLDEPLQTEMQLVVSDTKTAMTSLAHNFIPQEVRSWFSTRQKDPEL